MGKPTALPAYGRRGFKTFAQRRTSRKSNVIPITGLVSAKGADITNVKKMQRWAEEKLINQSIILSLVDAAKNKEEWKRLQQYWNTYHCMREVETADGRLYARYCKNRACSICCGIRKAKMINTYLPLLEKWEDPFTLVLTLTSPKAEKLKRTIDEMYAILDRIIDKYRKRASRGKGFRLIGIRSLECTYNPKADTYHPHFHFVLPNKQIAIALQSEWMKEGRKLWGNKAISQAGQDCKRAKGGNVEKAMVEAIKYSTKIFTEIDPAQKQKGKKGQRKIYIDAYDNIIAALAGRRIFDRFGFNGPKQMPETKELKYLKHKKKWKYSAEYADWLEEEGALTLTNYVPPPQLNELLNDQIIKVPGSDRLLAFSSGDE